MKQNLKRAAGTAAISTLALLWAGGGAHAACTGGPDVFSCLSEADYLAQAAQLGYTTFQEGFEDNTVWGSVRTPTTAPSITNQGVTWTANHATNEITTGSGAARTGSWGIYDREHGFATGTEAECDIDNPPEHCLWYDGVTGTRVAGEGRFYAAGGYVRTSTVGANIAIVLDGVNQFELGKPPDTAHYFYGVIDTRGFTSFQVREIDGKIGQKFLIFADDFTLGYAPPRPDHVGVRHGNRFRLDANGNNQWDGTSGGDVDFPFGMSTDIPVIGDWNGDGFDDVGIRRGSRFWLDANGNDQWDGTTTTGGDVVFAFGISTDTPVIGDWNGDGLDDVGVWRGNSFWLDANGNNQWDGTAGGDAVFRFGMSTDTPVIGDWNGDGFDDVGVWRGNRFWLDANGNDRWDGSSGGDVVFRFGMSTDNPVIGDWNADGFDDVGVRRGYHFWLDANGNTLWDGTAGGDVLFYFGLDTDIPVIGKW